MKHYVDVTNLGLKETIWCTKQFYFRSPFYYIYLTLKALSLFTYLDDLLITSSNFNKQITSIPVSTLSEFWIASNIGDYGMTQQELLGAHGSRDASGIRDIFVPKRSEINCI